MSALFALEPVCRHGRVNPGCPFCAPFVHHSETSLEASVAIHPAGRSLRELVYQAIKSSPSGLTDEEVVGATGLKANTARPRRVDLTHEVPSRIEANGVRRTSSGRNATVWVAKADS